MRTYAVLVPVLLCLNLEAETETVAVEGHCLLACSVVFLIHPGTSCAGVALSTVGWALLPRLSIKKTAIQACLQALIMGAFSESKFPLLR